MAKKKAKTAEKKPTKPKKVEPPKTTAQQLGSLIKSARDIMRKDKGLNGDLDRLPLLTWIMFLKFLDDREKLEEARAGIGGKKYKSAVEAPYRWRDWATNKQGITGDALIAFVNQDEATRSDGKRGAGLLAYLRGLQSTNGDRRRDVIATVFDGVINRMISGYLMRDVVNLVDGIHFDSTEEIHTLARLYESMLREMRDAAGDSGEFYTPRPVIQFMVAVTDPQLGEVVLDPACGTGGFLAESFSHLEKQCATVQDRKTLQDKSIRGGEAKPLPYMLSQMNLLLHGLDAPAIEYGNSLAVKITELGEKDRVDVILTNPPFGGEEEAGIRGNFPADKQTSETALLFLQLIMRKLRRTQGQTNAYGRAAVVVPDGFLFGDGVCARIKEELLNEFNLHTIVRLPNGVFSPYTPIRTNVLFFDRSGPTKHIWFYEHPLPEGRRNYTKTKPLQVEEFSDCKSWWKRRKANERAWKVEAEAIENRGFNLDMTNPSKPPNFAGVPPETIVGSLRGTSDRLKSLMDAVCEEMESLLAGLDVAGEAVTIAEFVKRSQRPVAVAAGRVFRTVGVKWWGKGVYAREVKDGSGIKAGKMYVIKTDDLVYNNMWARHGSVGIVPADLDGCVVTSDFPVFTIDQKVVLPQWFAWVTQTPWFWQLCDERSYGTSDRRRIQPDSFLGIPLKVPSTEDQSRITELLSNATMRFAELTRLREESDAELNALLPSILDRAFRGEK